MTKNYVSKLFSLFCMIGLIALVLFNPGNTAATAISFAIILCFLGVQIDDEITILFFMVNLIAALQITLFDVPLGSILEALFIAKCVLLSNIKFRADQLSFLTGILVIGLISSTVLELSFIRPIVYAVNLLMMLVLFDYTKQIPQERKKRTLTGFYISFVASFALTLIISFFRTDLSTISYHNRFTGLWTDPNFIGMFSALCICMLFFIADRRVRFYIIFLPLLFLFVFGGYLTYSRTFVLSIFFMAAMLLVALMRSKKTKALWKILGVILMIAAVYLIYTYYLSGIFQTRGILEHFGRDLTNGRLDDIHRAWVSYTSDPMHLMFGSGDETAHNTLIDFLLRYGPICAFLSILLVVSLALELSAIRRRSENKMSPVLLILYLVLLIYLFTLPMLDDDILYLLLGGIPLCLIEERKEEVSRVFGRG